VFNELGSAPGRGKAAGRASTRHACAALCWIAPRRIVAGDDAGVLSVWEWKGDGSLERVATFAEHDDVVSSLDADASGKVLSSSYDGTMKMWDLTTLTSGAAAAAGDASPSDAQPVRATSTFSGHGATPTHHQLSQCAYDFGSFFVLVCFGISSRLCIDLACACACLAIACVARACTRLAT
jgi:WD40 repeat protein